MEIRIRGGGVRKVMVIIRSTIHLQAPHLLSYQPPKATLAGMICMATLG